MANSLAQLSIAESLAARSEREKSAAAGLQKFDNLGQVISFSGGRFQVRTAAGNRVWVPQGNVITNGNPGRVLLTRPRLGEPFADGPVRG